MSTSQLHRKELAVNIFNLKICMYTFSTNDYTNFTYCKGNP